MKCRRGGRGAGGEGGGSYIKRNEDFLDILAVSCVIFLILLFHLPNGKSSPIWQAASIINNNCRVFIYKWIEELSGKSKVNGLICPYVLFCIGLILSHCAGSRRLITYAEVKEILKYAFNKNKKNTEWLTARPSANTIVFYKWHFIEYNNFKCRSTVIDINLPTVQRHFSINLNKIQ